jgi:glycosyltransferase involved in cell wall biosynthesis
VATTPARRPTAVLHVLPHRGGGAETYLDVLAGAPGLRHQRVALSAARTPLRSGPSIAVRWPGVARRAVRADVVHAHGDVAAMLALPLLRARPSVWTTHGLHLLRRADGPAGRVARAGIRAVVGATSVTLCCSEAERDELAALVPAARHDRLVVVPNGIALPPPPEPGLRAAVRAELELADGDVAALFLGQLEERKDPLTAVRAAAAAGAPLVLVVAGDGPLLEPVRAAAGSAVRVLGFRSDPERLLAAADLFVLPSLREGISFAVLEAMGRGLAMVVSDGPGNPEAVGRAGIVLPTGDVDAFAAALTELARDANMRTALGAAARERVAREFTVDRLREGVTAAYEIALARR